MRHIILRGNTYHYRRRIPQALQKYVANNSFYKSLSQDIKLAQQIATKIDTIFNEALAMTKMGLKPNLTELGLTKRVKHQTPTKFYLTMIERSDNAQKTTEMHMQVLSVMLPKDISDLTQSSIDEIISSIKLLPKRNIQKYKSIPIKKLLQLNIPQEDRLASRGINAYLKTLKSFLNFCYKRNYVEKEFDITLVKSNTGSREERKALNVDTIRRLIDGSKTTELQSTYTLLYLTGMRLSEAYKCKLTTINGIQCFDLTDTTIKLKTKNSYRLIPVHKSITDPEKMLEDIRSMNPDYIIKDCTKNLMYGTLYSLRHSFATHLASASVEPHIISELMGHRHDTMTLNRYVKGFPIKILKDSIDTL